MDEEFFVARLKSEPFKGEANNGTLRDALGWREDRYWIVRNRLLEGGVVLKAHGGPGGKTIIAPPVPELIVLPAPAVEIDAGHSSILVYEYEASLYEPMLGQIRENWIKDEGYDAQIVRITAAAGRRDTGGTWTRPDISMVGIQKFKFLRDPVFDVVTFEIKPGSQITVEAVFESLAHRQYATRSYSIYHCSKELFAVRPESQRIIALAEQHGIGIILASEPGDYNSWTEYVRARRWSPDPADLNDFIQRVFPSSDHDEIIKLTK